MFIALQLPDNGPSPFEVQRRSGRDLEEYKPGCVPLLLRTSNGEGREVAFQVYKHVTPTE
jgi:hypothetical protein